MGVLLREGLTLLFGVATLVLAGVLLLGVTALLDVVTRLTLPVVLPRCTTPPLVLTLAVPLFPATLPVGPKLELGLLFWGLATRTLVLLLL